MLRRSLKRSFVVLLALLALSVAVIPQAGAATTGERQALWRVNHERYIRHIRQLSLSTSLSNLARQHSCAMAAAQDLEHTVNLDQKVSGWWYLGENVGESWDLYEVHKAFMASPEHRENILDRHYRSIGVGICRDSGGTLWITNIFFG